MLRPWPFALLLLLPLPVPLPATASVGDVFGLGSRSAALANAATALAEGFEATYYNPARIEGPPRFSLGILAAGSLLSANGVRKPIEDPLGIVIGATAPLPLGGALRDRIHVGLGLFLLPDKIVREIGRAPADPHFPLFDNRTQRVVILPAVSFRLHPKLSLGIAANVLAALGGAVNVREGPLRGLDARVDEDLLTTFAVNAGISIRPTPFFTIALAFREEFSLPFFTNAETTVAGNRFELNLRARTLFEPATASLGTAIEVTHGLTLAFDLAYKRWSRFPGGLVQVTGALPLPVGPVSEIPLVPPLPEARFRDIFAVRTGVEWRAWTRGAWGLDLRGGYGFEPSPVPPQTEATSYVDGEKHTVSVGAGLTRSGRFALDAHLMLQLLGSTRVERSAGVLEGGGAVVSGGLVGTYYFQ
jgi:long-chain fatty acid transport protein